MKIFKSTTMARTPNAQQYRNQLRRHFGHKIEDRETSPSACRYTFDFGMGEMCNEYGLLTMTAMVEDKTASGRSKMCWAHIWSALLSANN